MESANSTHHALSELHVRPVERSEEARYQAQMARHHYLGALPKIGQTLWYVATWRDEWVAQLSLSGAALKCGVRDRWIGWDFRSQYGRLTLIANNSRFLILPGWHRPNLGSRVLSLTARRVGADWQARFGHPLLLLETFVDSRRFHGGVYRAANWIELGLTQGGIDAPGPAIARTSMPPSGSLCARSAAIRSSNSLTPTGSTFT
jgi:hypothetical protein